MWKETNNELHKQFVFDDFKQAFAFMTAVASVAEEQNHHPRWQNVYNKVDIWLSTHDADDAITDKDHHMAKAIDKLYDHSNSPTKASKTKPTTEKMKLYADGGSRGNPGPAASGYVLLDLSDKVVKEGGEFMGNTTNNQAEYNALKIGLLQALKMGVKDMDVYMDSLLVINQLKGVYKVRHPDIVPVYLSIKDITKQFSSISFTHVPRELNKLADAEVNKILDLETGRPKSS